MGLVRDRHHIAGLIVLLKDLGIITMYSEDVSILAAIHEYGPGFADE